MSGQAIAVARRILTEYWRQRRGLVFWAVFPALMLLLFGSIYRADPAMRMAFDATPSGILVGAALFFSGLGGTCALVVAERERHTLRRLLVSPLHPAAYFAGIVLAQGVVALGQALVVFGLAALMGAQFRGSWLLGAVVAALAVASYVGLGFFFGARFARRVEDINGPLSAFGVPLLVLGGAFFPIQLMPPWMLQLAWFDPVFHMNEALKAVALHGHGWQALQGHLLVLAAFAAASLALGVWSYRRLLAEEQRR